MKKLLFVTMLALLLALPLPGLAAQENAGESPADTVLPGATMLQNVEVPVNGLDDGSTENEKAVDLADILQNLNNIAANCKYTGKSYKDSSYEWLIMDMAAYAGLPAAAAANFTTATARQAYIDYAINEVATEVAKVTGIESGGVYAKAVLGLRAVGINPADLTTVNKTKLNVVDLLKATTTQNIYNASYMLMAYKQGSYSSTVQENQLISFLLDEQYADGAWGYNDFESGEKVSDADTTAMALRGLAPHKERPEVAAAIAKALAFLSGEQDDSGSFISSWTGGPSAATMAQVILALVALGIDPNTDEGFIKNDDEKDTSLLYGLLASQNADNDYFGIDWFGNDDEFSTEQAFCALIAVVLQKQLGSGACHPYEFSHMPSLPGVATSTGSTDEPPAKSDKNIKVYFTLKGPDSVWISEYSVTVPDDAKVYHVVIKALADNNYKQTGAINGYIKSITRPNGQTLAEFDYGPDSGWLYKVSDHLPNTGLTACGVAGGNHVLLYYTKDWTLDPDAGSFSGSPFGQAATATADVSVRIKATLGKDGQATAVLSGKDLSDFVAALAKNKNKTSILAGVAVDTPTGTASLNLTLPQEALTALGQPADAALLLQSALGEAKFDTATLKQLVAVAGKGDLLSSIALLKSDALPPEYRDVVGERPVYAFELKAGGQIISTFKGKVELFLPYTAAESEDINKLTVYQFDAEGQAEKLTGASYHSGRKGMICATGGFSLFAVAYEDTQQLSAYFTDVPESHWAAQYIYSLAEQGVINGKTPTLFAPQDSLTRAELTALLCRLSGDEQPQAKAHFADVAETAWYAQELAWAVKAGIIQGVGDNRFAPQQAVNRQDMAVMLMRYAAYLELDLPSTEPARTFSDDAAISAYAREAVEALQLAGLIGGYEDGSFRPKGSVSRAEAAKLLALMDEIV